jgi:asparagine synthase (glutamine-hydrolysing)
LILSGEYPNVKSLFRDNQFKYTVEIEKITNPFGGYLYFHAAPNPLEFDRECKRLLKDIHYFDVLRSDRSISSHGLEARTPFLDRGFVQSYLSIPDVLRDHRYNKNFITKYAI